MDAKYESGERAPKSEFPAATPLHSGRSPALVGSPPGGPLDLPEPSLWNWIETTALRRRFIRKYFVQLDTEYESLCDEQYKATTRAQIDALRNAYAARPTWGSNHRLEMLVMRGVPEAFLRSRLVVYRQRLLALAGEDRAKLIEEAFPSTAEGQPVAALRELAVGMLAEIQRLRHVRSEFEHLRNRILGTFIAIGVAFACVIGLIRHEPLSLSIAAGFLGAYFSVLQRLGALSWCPEFAANYHQVDRLFYNLVMAFLLALVEGAVAAAVLHAAFLGGLIDGRLFPEFQSLTIAGRDLTPLQAAAPKDTTEVAKLIFWCVLAGFSERLIPDVLTNFTESAARASRAASGVQDKAK